MITITIILFEYSFGSSEIEYLQRPSWVWYARTFGGGSGPPPRSVNEALAMVESLEIDGYNVVDTWVNVKLSDSMTVNEKTYGYTRPIWEWDWRTTGTDFEGIKAYTREGHKKGMRFLYHNMASLSTDIPENPQGFLPFEVLESLEKKHGDIYCRRANGEIDIYDYGKGAGSAWLSASHPKVIEGHATVIPKLFEDTGIDGFYSDWTERTCFDKYSVDRFAKDTNFSLPSEEVLRKEDLTNPDYRAWVMWCGSKYIEKIMVETREAIKKKDPEKILFAYNSRPTRLEHETLALTADLLGDESTERTAFYNVQDNTVQMRYNYAIQSHYNVPMIALFKSLQPSELFFCWALASTNGIGTWGMIPPCSRWQREYQDLFTRPQRLPGDVAILYSRKTRGLYYNYKIRDFHPRPYEYGEGRLDFPWAGWARVLQDKNILYDIILEGDINEKTLSDYKVLILSNTAVISDKDVEVIRDYVKKGGKLIATYETSLYDETGRQREDFALADLFGVTFKKIATPSMVSEIERHHPLFKAFSSGLKTGHMAQVELRTPEASVIKDTRGFPYLSINKVGKGRVAYIAGFPGAEVFSRPAGDYVPDGRTTDFTYNDNTDYKTYELLGGLINSFLVESKLMADAPKGVIINAMKGQYGGQEGMVIHILNAKGAFLSNGEKLNAGYRVYYPCINGPISLTIRNTNAKKAFMVSPDFNGKESLPVEVDSVFCRIEVPFLKRYSVVFLY